MTTGSPTALEKGGDDAPRTFLASASTGYRFPVLILIGAVVYLPCLSRLNRRMWTDVQRLYTALRA